MRMFQGVSALSLAAFVGFSLCTTSPGNEAFAGQVRKAPPPASGTATPPQPPMPDRNPTRTLASLKSQLDHTDHLVALRALHLALSKLPDGGTFIWRKRSGALQGLIKPTRAFRNADGQVCRHVIYAMALGRYQKQIEGIACRRGDGSWQL